MKITLELDLSPAEIRTILDSSIERVMNNAIKVGTGAQDCVSLSEGLREDASTLWQDCEELKPLTRKLWDTARDTIFRLKADTYKGMR